MEADAPYTMPFNRISRLSTILIVFGVWRVAGVRAMVSATTNNRMLSVRRRSILLFNSPWHSMLRYPPLFLQDYLS